MIPAVGASANNSIQVKPDPQKQKLKEVCQEFESLLTSYVFKSMRQAMMRAEEPDQANQIYEGMMDDMLASELSRKESGGLADLLYKELSPLLAKTPSKNSP